MESPRPRPRVALVMPALDEEKALPLVFADLEALRARAGHAVVDEILVVDNGSRDRTAGIARAAGALVLHEPQRGYGAACLCALRHLRHQPPDIVVFMDADRSDDAAQLPDLLRPIVEDGYDMVIGSRTRGHHERGALLPQARFGNWLATGIIRWRYGFRYTDLGPFRAVRYTALERLRMRDRDYGWTVEMQVRALQEGLRVTEVAVNYRRRIGRSKVSGTIGGSVRAGIKILATLWKLRGRGRRHAAAGEAGAPRTTPQARSNTTGTEAPPAGDTPAATNSPGETMPGEPRRGPQREPRNGESRTLRGAALVLFALGAGTAVAVARATREPLPAANVAAAGAAAHPGALAVATSGAATNAEAPFDHGAWDTLLHRYVDDDGLVAYRDLQEHDSAALYAYLDRLAAARPDAWPREAQLAFWINAYNAGIVSAVLQGRSAESLLGRGRLFKLWKFGVAGDTRTLDEIEHEILRKRLHEPRIHFAIVCASSSCPPLRNEAYVAAKLDAQLDDQARRFVNDPRRNVIDRTTHTLRLSKIFDWFGGDFADHGGLLPFLARYVADDATRDWLAHSARGAKLDYLDYDWTLNVQPGQRPRKESRQTALERARDG